jgi:acyl-homoserine-lactone acylase
MRVRGAGLLAAMFLAACAPPSPVDRERAALEERAGRVTITRDDWGIPHVHGKTDADAVFGLIYAQAEDDFNRIEMNYLNALGRRAEAEGESRIYHDLRMRLVVDEESLKALHAASPPRLQALMSAWADGLNYFLATHPEARPKVLARFEPWTVLAFTEGSIGWDIESVALRDLEAFYGRQAPSAGAPATAARRGPPGGSNGIAISGALTESGSPLLLINPHTSFFFRAEAQVRSDEGLNAYGAITWGQFFVYQGFNERAGWMHTSSGVDAVDEYAETVVEKPDGLFYRYDGEDRPVAARSVTIRYRTPEGQAQRVFTVYRTHHGPVVREADGKWIAVRLMDDPIHALTQSFMRMKATGYAAFRELMDLHTNSSNNTVYADADGTIAYFHANFVPRRDPRFDWSKPVDGSDTATEWRGIHAFDESPNVRNPPHGWIQNTNNSPWSAAGPDSPRQTDYPAYMDRAGENARGIHALRVLSGRRGFTLDSLIAAAYDRELPAFDELLPSLFAAYRDLPAASPLRRRLADPVALLERWDRRWAIDSIPASVAIYWAQELHRLAGVDPEAEGLPHFRRLARTTGPSVRLEALAAAVDRLTSDFGIWKTPWGGINRFQRLTGDIVQEFRDAAPSIPVGFPSGQWGSLASFDARTYPGTKRMYGTSGNSFVAVVEFGQPLRAKAITAGGGSGDPRSPHFNDQAERYASGNLRDVYFHPEALSRHTARVYHPGQ